MAENHPSINLDHIYAALDNALDDLYHDGLLSAAIYTKKNQRRMLLAAINSADRHICLQLKLSERVAIYVPSGQRTIFFSRQKEYIGQRNTAHADVKDTDTSQYALLLDERAYLDIISVLSNHGYAYGELPVEESADPTDVLVHSLPSQTENRQGRKFQTTSGRVVTERPSGRRFYVEPNSRKMVLSKAYSSDQWIVFLGQIAPVQVQPVELTKSELELYRIRAPYFAQRWLIHRAMVEILPPRAAAESGYMDTEQAARREAFTNKPGTGNVIIEGDELDGNYDSNFVF